MRRKLIVALLVLIALVLVAAIALPWLVDVNQYRDLIQAEAEKAIGRKVTLGEMKLSILPTFGIQVAEVGIEDLLRSESLVVGARIVPLIFGGDIEVSRVVLVRPTITLRRDAGGTWNVAGLAGGGGGPAAEAGAPARGFELSHLRIREGTVVLHTSTKGGERTINLGCDLTASLRISGGAVTAQARGKVEGEGIAIAFDGGGEWSNTVTRFAASVEDTDIEVAPARALVESLGQAWPLAFIAGGRVGLDASVEGTWPAALSGSGSVNLVDMKIEGAAHPVSAKASFDATAKDAGALLEIARFEATLGKSRLAAKGTVDNRRGGTVVDLDVPESSLASSDLMDLVALTGSDLPFEFEATRPLRIEAHVRGDVVDRKDLEIRGAVEVEGGTFKHPSLREPMKEIQGRLAATRDGFDLSGFRAVIGGSDVEGTLSVKNLARPRVEFALASRRADFWELMSFLDQDRSGGAAPSPGPSGDAGDDLLAVTSGRGTLRIASGTFGTLAFTDLDSTLSLSNKVVTLDPVTMSLYGGTLSGGASMNMTAQPPTVSVKVRPERIGAGPLLAENLDMRDMLTGAITGEIALSASGDALDAILRSATGTGSVRIEDGTVGAVNVLGVLSKASGLLGEKSLQQLSSKLAEEGTDFSRITAGLNVGGGKITTRDFQLVSPDIDLTDDGTLDMLKGTINIEGRIVFSKAISQAMVDEKSRAVDAFWDDRIGRVSVPLTLSGPLDAPMPGIDWNVAGKNVARRKLSERLEKAGLGGLLGGEAPSRSAAVQDPGATGDATEPPTGESAADGATDPGDLSCALDRKEFSGNLLAPDLKIRGTLGGRSITRAELVVTDRDGRELAQESLMKHVQAVYQANDPAAPVPFRLEIDGKKLAFAKRRVTIHVTLEDVEGHRLTRRWEADR